jgi:hypothetical protein
MRNTLTVALLSAASLCAFACVTPAAAQTFAPGYGYGYGAGSWPYGPTGTFAGSYPTIPSLTGTGAYSYSSNANAPKPYPNGECQILAGNRVCTPTPAYGYGYGVGGPFGFGAAIAAPVNAAAPVVAAPVQAAGAVAAAPFGVAPAYRYGYGYGAGPYPYGPTATFAGGYPTVPSNTGAPAYSYSTYASAPRPAPGGSCQILAGNRVCTGWVP